MLPDNVMVSGRDISKVLSGKSLVSRQDLCVQGGEKDVAAPRHLVAPRGLEPVFLKRFGDVANFTKIARELLLTVANICSEALARSIFSSPHWRC
jgi:hypothetical protein